MWGPGRERLKHVGRDANNLVLHWVHGGVCIPFYSVSCSSCMCYTRQKRIDKDGQGRSELKNRTARRPGPLQVRPAPATRWSRLKLRSGAGPGQVRAGQAKGEPRRGPGTCDRNGFEIACRECSRFSSLFAPTIGGNWHPPQRTAHLLSWCALFHHRSFDKTKSYSACQTTFSPFISSQDPFLLVSIPAFSDILQ